MARVIEVKSARAAQKPRACVMCGHEVEVGEPYRYVAKKVGVGGIKLIFCKDHYPRPSHLASGRAAELAEILEHFEDADKDSVPDAIDALSALADEVQDLADDIEESASNIESAFDYSPQAEAMQETASELSQWSEQIDGEAEALNDVDDDTLLNGDWLDSALAVVEEVPDLNLTG